MINKSKYSPNDTDIDDVLRLIKNILTDYEIDISETENRVRDVLKTTYSAISIKAYRIGKKDSIRLSLDTEDPDMTNEAFKLGFQIGSGEKKVYHLSEHFSQEFKDMVNSRGIVNYD